jgi:hypothetical protein
MSRQPSASEREPGPSRLSGHTTPLTDGYPSWLPRRPPPPGPASTLPSMHVDSPEPLPAGTNGSGDSGRPPFGVGRKPTPRSIRVVRVHGGDLTPEIADSLGRRIPTDATKVATPAPARVYSRASAALMTPTLLGSTPAPDAPRPRFRSRTLRLELLRDPSPWARLHFVLLPILAFAHIPLQSFLDFNAVYVLLQ